MRRHSVLTFPKQHHTLSAGDKVIVVRGCRPVGLWVCRGRSTHIWLSGERELVIILKAVNSHWTKSPLLINMHLSHIVVFKFVP